MNREQRVSMEPARTRTSPTAQALSGRAVAVSKSSATKDGRAPSGGPSQAPEASLLGTPSLLNLAGAGADRTRSSWPDRFLRRPLAA